MSQAYRHYQIISLETPSCSEVDLTLWRRAVDDVRPLPNELRSHHAYHVLSIPSSIGSPVNHTSQQSVHPSFQPPSPSLTKISPRLIDRHQMRRIAKGDRKIDARLDLHGLGLAAAYETLITYIVEMRACGKQIVLIITGKGRADKRGKIKAELPRWLELQPLASIVHAHGPACPQHGGEGARYLMLRSLPR